MSKKYNLLLIICTFLNISVFTNYIFEIRITMNIFLLITILLYHFFKYGLVKKKYFNAGEIVLLIILILKIFSSSKNITLILLTSLLTLLIIMSFFEKK